MLRIGFSSSVERFQTLGKPLSENLHVRWSTEISMITRHVNHSHRSLCVAAPSELRIGDLIERFQFGIVINSVKEGDVAGIGFRRVCASDVDPPMNAFQEDPDSTRVEVKAPDADRVELCIHLRQGDLQFSASDIVNGQ
jgi:hypothetical protein